jgi:hypothetical protein
MNYDHIHIMYVYSAARCMTVCACCVKCCVDVPSNAVEEAEKIVPEDEAELASGETAKDLQEAGKG